jgi:hypothetical protein
MKSPKEDPEDKAARLRERRITDVERSEATQRNAAGMTSDLATIYGLKGLKGLFTR